MGNKRSNPIERWEREEKERVFREKDKQAEQEAEDLVEAFKMENKERQEKEKAERDAKRLQKKIDKCDWSVSQEISNLLEEILNKYSYMDKDVPVDVEKSFKSLLDRATHIDKNLMKQLIKVDNDLWVFFSLLNPERLFDKCDFDDELIYNSIMAWYYRKLEGIVDENKLEEQRKKALKDVKEYFYPGGFAQNQELFWLDLEEHPEYLLERFGSKWDLDKDFLEYVASNDNMNSEDIDRKYFKWMSDDEFNEKLLYRQFHNKDIVWDEYDRMPNGFALEIISEWYWEDVLNHLEKFEITGELLYSLLNGEERDFQDEALQKLVSLKKKFNNEETLLIFEACIRNPYIADFVFDHKEQFELDYEVAKKIANLWCLYDGFWFGPEDFNVTDDQWQELLNISYDEQKAEEAREILERD